MGTYISSRKGKEMIRTIYKNIAAGEKNGIRSETEKEIADILYDGDGCADWQDPERYRDTIYQAVSIAEEGGFVMGFQYAVDLLMGCMRKRDR